MLRAARVLVGSTLLLGTGCGTTPDEAPRDAAPASVPEPPPPPTPSVPAPPNNGGGLGALVEKEVQARRTDAVDWPTYQGNLQRTGLAEKAHEIAEPRVRWKQHVGIQGYLNAPLVLGASVVVPSSGAAHNMPDPKDGLYALEVATGKEIWHASSFGDANGATAADGVVVFTSDDRRVHAVDVTTGTERWTVERESTVYSTPLVLGTTVVVGDGAGRVVGIALDTGKLLWEHGYTGAIRGGLASDGKLVFAVSQGGDVAAIDPAGTERWRRAITRPSYSTIGAESIEGYNAPVVDGERLIVPFARDTYYDSGPALLAVSTADGTELWRAAPGAPGASWGNLRSSPALMGGTLVWAEPYSGDVAGADATTGAPRFRTEVGACLFPQYASPVIAGALAYVPRHDGHLYAVALPAGTLRWKMYLGDSTLAGGATPPAIEAMTGCDWAVPAGSPLFSPPAIASDGTLFVGSGEGWLYAIEDARATP